MFRRNLYRTYVSSTAFSRYCVVGLVTLLIFSVLSSAPVAFGLLPPAVATGIAVLVAGIFGYLAHYSFTFRSTKPAAFALPRYIILLFVNALFGSLIVAVAIDYCNFSAVVANGTCLAAVTITSYLFMGRAVM